MKKWIFMLGLVGGVMPINAGLLERWLLTPQALAADSVAEFDLAVRCARVEGFFEGFSSFSRSRGHDHCGAKRPEPTDAYPKQWLASLSPSTRFAVVCTHYAAYGQTPSSEEYHLVQDLAKHHLAAEGPYEDLAAPKQVVAEVTVAQLRAHGLGSLAYDLAWHERLFSRKKPEWSTGVIAGAEICGRRDSMEDAMTIARNERYIVLGVFDGHGGTANVADYLGSFFASALLKASGNEDITDRQLVDLYSNIDRQVLNNVCRGSCSVRMLYHCKYPHLIGSGGSTATVAVIDTERNELIMLNLGDSRMVLVGEDGAVLAATVDHTPSDPAERDRIEAAGGVVTSDGLLNGSFPLSRAFGDFGLKPLINPDATIRWGWPDVEGERRYPMGIEPAITRVPLPDKGFLVLACDGLWDVASNEAVGRYVAEATVQGESVDAIATMLVRTAYEGPAAGAEELRPSVSEQSNDNISVMVASIGQLREKGLLAKK